MRSAFIGINTLEELKKTYRDLAMKYHPDRGGDVEIMKEINNLYDEFFTILKNTHKNKDGNIYTKENPEKASEFKDIIEKLIRMKGLEIEIIGSFIWLGGNTKAHKDAIKTLGFKWHNKKKLWYKAPEGYKRYHGKKEYSIDEIRGMYGSSGKFTGQEDNAVMGV